MITQEEVPLTRVQPLLAYVDERRLRVAQSNLTLWQRHGIPLFAACWMKRSGELDYRVVMPPVAELHGDRLAVVDGVHRLYAAWLQQQRAISIVVVRGDLPRPASRPVDWDELKAYDKRKRYISRRDKFRALRLEDFRPAASYLRSTTFIFESLAELRAHAVDAADHAGETPEMFWCREHDTLDDCHIGLPKRERI